MLKIYLIEDESDQAELIKIALSNLRYPSKVDVFPDPDSFRVAMRNDAIRDRDASVSMSNCLVILDLKLGSESGFEVLDFLKSEPVFATIPVVILSASKKIEDIQKSYKSRAVCFTRKPFDLEVFDSVVTQLFLTNRIKI